MKKLLIVTMVLVLIFSMVGCKSKDESISKELTSDEEILNLARHIEKLDGEFYRFDIGYEDYFNKLKEIDNHLSETVHNSDERLEDFHIYRCPITVISHKIIIEDKSHKEIDKGIKELVEGEKEIPWEIEKSKISKVYTDEEKGFKYVFSKMDWGYTDEKYFSNEYEGKWAGDMWSIRRYTFVKEEGNWKLLYVEREDKLMVGDKEKEPKFGKFNGEEVEFEEVIDD